MALALKELREKLTKSLSLKFEGYTLNLDVWVGITGNDYQKMTEEAGDDPILGTAHLVTGIVKGWDILGDDGKPLPIDVETVLSLPQAVTNFIRDEVAKFIKEGGLTKNK